MAEIETGELGRAPYVRVCGAVSDVNAVALQARPETDIWCACTLFQAFLGEQQFQNCLDVALKCLSPLKNKYVPLRLSHFGAKQT